MPVWEDTTKWEPRESTPTSFHARGTNDTLVKVAVCVSERGNSNRSKFRSE
eukprot:CAMPEP_0184668572 /NCGR_PEP_ID=MMETSP0308-20130426/72973_1 /TAXON_ID=38269 /ORGANISM="Gloeochaete witrockiana, Strain SAG 46.84" /LENGTH=50 /DNA_ID=CAMNT_0027114371 /DNA_START=12 /DNA_END=161 /DNA_ORIENTATION=-